MPGSLIVIGGGLAGCEAAWQAAGLGVEVSLIEMRPKKTTPAHRTPLLAELVCSNSFKSEREENAVGLLKKELLLLDSLLMTSAYRARVPAGQALAVDRDLFGEIATEQIGSHPLITILREEAVHIPEGSVVLATGPLTGERLESCIESLLGRGRLYYYDAIAPLVEAGSIDEKKVFRASRYGKGGDDYINCPLTEEEYKAFRKALITAERTLRKDFEKGELYEGCVPLEELASRGEDAIRFGPLKPVGLIEPSTGKPPYAVVQLRRDNVAATHYGMVGFQTGLKRSEQKRIFTTIPGLEKARFVRYGQIHKNTFIHAPHILHPTLDCCVREGLFFAGQLSGTEGYTEAVATGLVAGKNAARHVLGLPLLLPPPDTMLGALLRYLTNSERKDVQPVNAAFGLLPQIPGGKRKRRMKMAQRALASLSRWKKKM